jgi:hypothetical protein
VQRLVTTPIKTRYRNNPLLARVCQDALFEFLSCNLSLFWSSTAASSQLTRGLLLVLGPPNARLPLSLVDIVGHCGLLARPTARCRRLRLTVRRLLSALPCTGADAGVRLCDCASSVC